MRYITECDSRRLFAFYLPQEGLDKLTSITEAYLTTQLERGFSTLDFYKSLLFT
jgi:DNA repair protein RecO (recombination protein O)